MKRLLNEDGKRKAFHIPFQITKKFLDANPNCYFIFGDNTEGRGYGGAAKLRDHSNAIGFVTKRFPSNWDKSFYTLENYSPVFEKEKLRLIQFIENNKHNWILISKLGGGLANRYHIFENFIEPWLESLVQYDNIILLY